MKRHSKFISVLLAFALVFSMCCLSVGAVDGDTATIKTPSGTVTANVGDQITVNMWMYYPETINANNDAMYSAGFQANMGYDESILAVSEETSSANTAKALAEVFPTNYIYYEELDLAIANGTNIYNFDSNPIVLVSTADLLTEGAGFNFARNLHLMSIKFDVLAAGETDITFTFDGDFVDRADNNITKNMGNTEYYAEQIAGSAFTSDVIDSEGNVLVSHDNGYGLNPFTGESIEPVEPPTPSETEPTETEPEDTEPEDTEPEDTEPSETEPEDTEPSETDPTETEPVIPEGDWYVVGTGNLCNGQEWVPGAPENLMTYNTATGLFEITFESVGDAETSESNPESFMFKVNKGADWGEAYPVANISGAISAQDWVKVTYNPVTNEVNWDSPSKFEITNHVYRVAGSAALCGSDWDPHDDNNLMTFCEEHSRYEMIYTGVAAGAYEYKIVMDGATWIPDGGSNPSVTVAEDNSTVTIWYNEDSGEYGVDVSYPEMTDPSETEPSETEPSETEPSETEPSETEPSETEPSETEPSETEPTLPFDPYLTDFYVVGTTGLTGYDWMLAAPEMLMTYNEDARLYEITIENVGDENTSESNPLSFQFKVSSAIVDWDEEGAITCPPADAANISGAISAQDWVKITYNPVTNEVEWDSPSKFVITDHIYRVAGSTDLCGSNWNPTDDNNLMTYNEETGRYEKVYTNLAINDITGYEYKIVMDGASWIPEGVGNNPEFFTDYDNATAVVWYNEATGEYGVDVSYPEMTDPSETEPSETEPSETEPSETEPSETEPSETEPSETEPSETEPSETEPSETEPSETEPSETEPSETEPSETEPSETEPSETEPSETDPTEPSGTTDPSETDPSGTTDPSETDPSGTTDPSGATDSTGATGATGATGGSTTGGGSSTTGGGSSSTTTTTGKVATGDSTNVIMLLIILAAAAGVVVFARKRVNEK